MNYIDEKITVNPDNNLKFQAELMDEKERKKKEQEIAAKAGYKSESTGESQLEYFTE